MTRTVLVMRHGAAEEPAQALIAGRKERQRELTQEGWRKLRESMPALTRLVDGIDLLVSSPLTRAIQTADVVAEAFPDAKRVQHPGLSPGVDHVELLKWLLGHKGVVALVGHEPDLSEWIGYMVSGSPRSLVEMKKGAVCKLEMQTQAMPGEARIAWHLTSRQLREMAPDR